MKRYFCDFCESEIVADSNFPCDKCVELLNKSLLFKRNYVTLTFGQITFSMPNQLMGELSDESSKKWFSTTLPSVKEFAELIKPVDVPGALVETTDVNSPVTSLN